MDKIDKIKKAYMELSTFCHRTP